MGARRIHHVGIAVAGLDEAIERYGRFLGARVEERETVADQGVEAALLLAGEGRLELLAPLGPETAVGRFLARHGPGMHHVALEVDDVAAELARLAAAGVELVDERPRRGLLGREVAFVHPAATGGFLAELVGRG